MRKYLSFITAFAFVTALLTGCGNRSEKAVKPLLGLSWFAGYDEVLAEMSGNNLIAERETEDKTKQRMQDYEAVKLYGTDCDLTLCFTDSGLVGFNYHDVKRNQSYRQWFSEIEKEYGIPTEEGSGIASWYDDPLGRNTAVYLFNLEEGVQVSFYATSDSPDQSYEKQKERYIPTPELRSPVVAVEETPTVSSAETTALQQETTSAATSLAEEEIPDPADEPETDEYSGKADVQTAAAQTSLRTETVTTSTTVTTTAKIDRTKDFLLNGLKFYSSPESEKRKMEGCTQINEYRTEEAGQPWELIMEYENVPYLGKKCDGVLCFTSLGLVGVNYFDSESSDYSFWLEQLTDIYGSPDETQYDYSVWSDSTAGSGTTIYIFALEDGVQISFFVDDTGSEIVK
ncbi:MAG TPA: hypothetical protein PLH98_08990 [Ruminococcus flavefaciens]|nr:hypothetical protein [Ruminococcus flavefaciens]HQM00672.1 hypothetical protein [Ruminococcus flavefaciens]